MPKNSTKKLQPLQGRAAFQPDTFNADDNTIEVVFATETPVLRYDWWDDAQFFEVLTCADGNVRMDRIQTAPVVDTHNTYSLASQFGTVVKAWIDLAKKECRAQIKLSSTEGDKEIVQKIKDGIIRNISVGYRVYKVEVDEAPENATATRRATDWEPFEISFVPMPADPNSAVRTTDTTPNEVTIISKFQNSNTMTDAEKAALKAERKRSAEIFKACRAAGLSDEYANSLVEGDLSIEECRTAIEAKKNEKPADKPLNPKEAAKAERIRMEGIRTAARVAGIEDEAFVSNLIDTDVTLDNAREQIINKAAETNPVTTRSQQTTMKINVDETDKFREAAEVGMCLRSAKMKEKDFTANQVMAAREFRGFSFIKLATDCLIRSGMSYNEVRSMSDFEIAKRAITSSTSDFSVLLEGTARRILLSAYTAIPDTWRQWCSVGTVTDFRPHYRLRLGSMSRLDKIVENAELKNKKINDATKESVQAYTYGNTINLSREMIINDDLDGFTRLPADLGRAAARGIEIDAYALLASNPTLTDGVALFHATHGNLATGAAMSVASFDDLRVKMAKQKDPNNYDFLNIRPAVLLCDVAYGGDARTINEAQYDPDTANKLQRPNKSRGIFNTIIDSPQINGTAYYAFANPADEPVIEVSFLNGVQTPYLESEESFDQLGRKWRVYHDYGVGAVGFRGAVKNAGA